MRTIFKHALAPALLGLVCACACSDDSSNGGGDGSVKADGPKKGDAGPVADARVTGGDAKVEPVTPGQHTYRLTESTPGLVLWTAPCARKIQTADRAPAETRSGLSMSAARREFEPVQLVMGPGSGAVTVTVAPFPNLGSGQRVSVATASYEQGWAEKLAPLAAGGQVTLGAGQGAPVWITVYVPEGAPKGEHATTVTLVHGSQTVKVPLSLHVHDFALPKEIHYATQLNISISGLAGPGGEEQAKTLLFEHRMTPKSPTWPSGFNYGITWDNANSSQKCEVLWDEPDESPPYSIKHLAKKYILGQGWNGVGFPNAMLFQFVDNSTPRPATFCGISRGDHFGTSAYNAEWSQFLGALEAYLKQNGYIDKAYYYVQNEPQDAADHKLAAHLCRLTRKAAPALRIAVSEEPKPEIAEDPGGACGYDIWIAHVQAYQPTYALERQKLGEQVWLYSLDHDPDPYFNPTRVDRQGLHQRIIPWVSWHHRARGWAYYDAGRFFDGSRPTVRAELLREGFEDYEYLYLANGGKHPAPGVKEALDATVDSAASSLTSWTKDPDALMTLRHELGRFIDGSRQSLPVLKKSGAGRPRAAYYVNFQDPKGKPAASPLVVDGKTFIKVGWAAYDAKQLMGWSGQYINDPNIGKYGYDDKAGYDELQRSYLYDDYGRKNLFEFGLESGRYRVTVGVGRPAKGYAGDPHNLTVEGVKVVDDEVTTDAKPVIERTAEIDLLDGSLSLEVGGKSQKTGDYAYTFLGYMTVEPI
jgi:hypothetical protein